MSNVQGIGIDILFLPRIAALAARRTPQRLASRILCHREYQLWSSIPTLNHLERLKFLAVRWSVKEAAYKALQPRLRPTWKQLSFLHDSASGSRKPFLHLVHASACLGVKLHASVSHDRDYVNAMVLAQVQSSDAP